MKEDLRLYGNELNYANAVWSAAYVFGQVPSNLLLTRVCTMALSDTFIGMNTYPPRSTFLCTLPSSSSRGAPLPLPMQASIMSTSSMFFASCTSLAFRLYRVDANVIASASLKRATSPP